MHKWFWKASWNDFLVLVLNMMTSSEKKLPNILKTLYIMFYICPQSNIKTGRFCALTVNFECVMHINSCTKMKFSIKGFFSKCDKIGRKSRIWSHLLQKSLILFGMDLFRAAHEWGEQKSPSLKSVTQIIQSWNLV